MSDLRTRKRIYLSGPMTGWNILENVTRAIGVYRELIEAGFAPLCPHLNYYADQAGAIPHAVWMEIDLPWVAAADAVLRIPGESPGSDIEQVRAELLGVPVFTSLAALLKHFDPDTEN